ncbi:hypothetical protein [Methylobacterium sp. WL7]|uniref:hypothetical protein n=1 Tax=Methylobacterium sp. WL7 TaxID=2603900 RepID=UPI00164FF5A7|nr:hypothetical protein [Methylobacterium sp. WL7]
MSGTERVEELDSNDVSLPTLPEPQAPEPNAETSDATTGSEAEMRAEEAYIETIKSSGV